MNPLSPMHDAPLLNQLAGICEAARHIPLECDTDLDTTIIHETRDVESTSRP